MKMQLLSIELNGVSKEDLETLEEYLNINHWSYFRDEEKREDD